MRTLIDDLLSFSKTKENSKGFEAVDLNLIVQDVIIDLQERLEGRDAKISLGKLPTVNGVPFQLTQLVNNLLENALKFSKRDTRPILKIFSEPTSTAEIKKLNLDTKKLYWKISISDNGVGFNDAHGKKIFEVFQRLHNRKEYQGTGIGLAIVKKIVLNHNGAVTAQSKLGAGATFNVYLPKG
jgi:light-regulated signal transduction histidine kinase (bacteriophytochrome)